MHTVYSVSKSSILSISTFFSVDSLMRSREWLTLLFVSLLIGLIGLTASACAGTHPDVPDLTSIPQLPAKEAEVETPDVQEPRPTVTQYAGTVSKAVESYPGNPLMIFTTDFFAGSGNCASCHTGLADAAGNDVSIDTHWRSTMMANAARDPIWQAKVSSEVARTPALADVIQDKCSTCHMPMARTEATEDGESTLMFDDGFLAPDHALHQAAIDGVSCTLCHQVQEMDLGEHGSFSGKYVVDTVAERPDRVTFGPFGDIESETMRASVGYTPEFGAQTLNSDLCATCHTLYTPFLDDEGNIAGEFPEQTPYLEWQHSDAGNGEGLDISCQECHMPAAEGNVVISNMPRGRLLQPREPFGQHHFVGGNAFMLGLLIENAEELELTASTAQLQATQERIIDQLQGAAARLSIADTTLSGD